MLHKLKHHRNPRVVKVVFEKDKQIIRATITEKEVAEYAESEGLTFMAALRKLLDANKRIFSLVLKRRYT